MRLIRGVWVRGRGFANVALKSQCRAPGEGVSWSGDESSLSRERRSGKNVPSQF